MTDHKFEPFEKVLVRDGNSQLWRADFFSHNDGDSEFPFCCIRDDWRFCIPYTPETAHLLGTSKPYEPPKPPHEYEWGQKVEVNKNKVWVKGIISYTEKDSSSAAVIVKGEIHASIYPPERIRPLPYEPPRPTADESKRFKAGQMVEIRGYDDNNEIRWFSAVYLEHIGPFGPKNNQHKVYDFETHDYCCQPPDEIRPLPDTAAH